MKIIHFIAEKIHEMHLPKYLSQLIISGLVSVTPAVPISLLDRLFGWYIDNQVFLTMVFLAVVIDHVLGSFVHFQIKHDFSIKKNLNGLLTKGFSVCAGYVLFEMIHQIVDDVQFIAIYFKVILQLTVMLYPVLSALKNLSIITGGKFPPNAWFVKFDSFNKDLDLEHFKTKKDEKINDDSFAAVANDELSQQEESR